MRIPGRASRVLLVAGLAAMILGAVDPLEGSVIILGGMALAALGAALAHGRRRKLVYGALALVGVGVGALFGLSAIGGIGGSGPSLWWGLLVLPYPVGWVVGLVGTVQNLRERASPPAAAH